MENIQLSLFGRTYPELFRVTAERILEPCLKKSQTPIFQCLQVANGQPQEWLEGGRLTPLGESLMLNIGEYPNVENESTLSEILEDNVPEKYYLSPKACLGILRRAKNKGRKLPDNLRIALEQKVAEGGEVLGLDFAHADSVVRTYKDITPTLVQNMGRGGGQTPCIMYEQRTIAIDQGGGKSQCGITTELSPTLTCTHGGEPVIYSEKRNVIPLRDEVTRNKASNGLGVGKVGGPCPTLTTADIHSVFYEAYQHHGYRESDTSGTLTAGQNNTVRGDTPLIVTDKKAFEENQHGGYRETQINGTLRAAGGSYGGGSETLITESTKTKGNIPSTPKGKGTHKAADRLQYWLRQTERKPERYYYLKMDISKYFYRVDHDILLKILARRIKDQRLLNLLEKIINCESMNFGLPPGKEPDEVAVSDRLSNKGMPIGNLTSQMFANIYLNEVDQYAKHELGLHYYIRYMDDIIILHHDKKYLAGGTLWQ